MDTKLLEDAITLLIVINPIAASVQYVMLTTGMERQVRLAVARRACIAAGAILLVFIAIGEIVLDGMGVQLPAFRTAGGLILLLVALRMVLGTETGTPAAGGPQSTQDVAIFPLATPFIAGPGAIMASVLLTDNGRFGIVDQAVTAGVAVLIVALTYACLAGADFLLKYLGTTGSLVLSRVMGLVLAALAMQTLLEGLRPYFNSLTPHATP